MSKLKFDLSQRGLQCVLKPHQVEIMHFFWNEKKPLDSRTVHRHILSTDVQTKSRASVINFLNWMVDASANLRC